MVGWTADPTNRAGGASDNATVYKQRLLLTPTCQRAGTHFNKEC